MRLSMKMDLFSLLRAFLYLLFGFLLGLMVSWGMNCLGSASATCGSNTVYVTHENKLLVQSLRRDMMILDPLYAGVVTSGDFLRTRAHAVNKTWGGMIASNLEFYVGEGQGMESSLPLVRLPGIDDTYPPQKKVYAMYKYMYDNYIDRYHWFLRADDDLYVRIHELKDFLSKLDSSQPLYIGSPGKGRKEDLKRLKLRPSDVFCMGGPGMVLSRALLRKLGPHLQECLTNVVVSYNEDVEVGRCINRRLGIYCTKSRKMTELFFHDYSNGKDFFSMTGTLRKLNRRSLLRLNKVITFHPLKQTKKMYSIHEHFVKLHLERLRAQISKLESSINV
ncbi:PREDICTED: chondroitin sulfate synthase 1-like [Amphimedon queenslandica]|uniref:Hexosyltransferase n=1 Tax=Amphimedon queenslandica TaxID=400682 RepID=A0A1X7V579_AMPQE|nr:PREDICTED: chondroitin sulfate synthase 1-like [Amphimedon queenslandica]|eukprot:XP_019850623.1 PREDICTED: chondroitin sulfate synthase 1-like [Amphimedon queenslandica]